ncbi:MAG: XRE family transcriptional regulator [Spirochaetales bacterium]|nr:XRE family transcriptional regulator [Spirochaetales bacterium]
MESRMNPADVQKARLIAEREIMAIRLADLRERQGTKQSDLKDFSQTAVSKLEHRKDMKISTLIEYLENIGMGMEIRVYRKSSTGEGQFETLLKV